MRRSPFVVLIAMAFACGGSPTTPSPSPDPSVVVHDTLNAAGSAGSLDNFSSELSGAYDRQVYDDFVSAAATSVRAVAWQGMRPTTRPPAGFYIAFIADSGGFPLRQADEANPGRLRALHATAYSFAEVHLRMERPHDGLNQG